MVKQTIRPTDQAERELKRAWAEEAAAQEAWLWAHGSSSDPEFEGRARRRYDDAREAVATAEKRCKTARLIEFGY